jgi:hypothetical protein
MSKDVDAATDRDLAMIGTTTEIIDLLRSLERTYLARRTDLIWRVRKRGGVTYQAIAERTGTSTVAVHKSIASRIYEERIDGVAPSSDAS